MDVPKIINDQGLVKKKQGALQSTENSGTFKHIWPLKGSCRARGPCIPLSGNQIWVCPWLGDSVSSAETANNMERGGIGNSRKLVDKTLVYFTQTGLCKGLLYELVSLFVFVSPPSTLYLSIYLAHPSFFTQSNPILNYANII